MSHNIKNTILESIAFLMAFVIILIIVVGLYYIIRWDHVLLAGIVGGLAIYNLDVSPNGDIL